MYTDVKNRIIYITQTTQPLNRIKSIKGEEKFTEAGNLKQRRTKKKYGIKYNNIAIKKLEGLVILPNGDRRRKGWEIIIREPGESMFIEKIGKPKKSSMGKCKHRPSKHKFQGINHIPYGELIRNKR